MSNLTVMLPWGRIQGRRDRRVPGTLAFLGLPYAAPPVGTLRFAPPAPCSPSDCPPPAATRTDTSGFVGADFAEATRLTLNVWAPANAHDRPVLFWIHDGTAAGQVDWARRFGARFAAEHGVVVVAPDCRRGALGYLDLTAVLDGFGNGNFGLLDQMEALTWVATHIRAFGGDASAITVSGRGDGAYAAALLAGLPRTAPLVRRLLLPEGMPAIPLQTPAAAARVAVEFCDTLGLEPASAGVLRDLDAATIAQAESASRLSGGRSPFGLVAHDDFPFLEPGELLRTTPSPVEVMVGSPAGKRGAEPTRWTVWRCGGARPAERMSTSVRRPPAGYGRAVGAFLCTGDLGLPGGSDASRNVLVERNAGRSEVDST